MFGCLKKLANSLDWGDLGFSVLAVPPVVFCSGALFDWVFDNCWCGLIWLNVYLGIVLVVLSCRPVFNIPVPSKLVAVFLTFALVASAIFGFADIYPALSEKTSETGIH